MKKVFKMLRLVSRRLDAHTFTFINQHKAIFWSIFALSTILCCVHTTITIRRYLKHEIRQTLTTIQKDKLPLPIVTLQLDSFRNTSAGPSKPQVEMRFKVTVDRVNAENWTYYIGQNYLTFNRFNYNMLSNTNISLDQYRKKWPVHTVNSMLGYRQGVTITGYLNRTNFIEYPDSNWNEDRVSVYITSFESDAWSSAEAGIRNYRLLPCEQLEISIEVEQYKLINRSSSPCRDDYPETLRKLTKEPMTPDHFYNGFLAPKLPYDPITCEDMCASRYWQEFCNCFVSSDVWLHAGKPDKIPMCSDYGTKCTRSTAYETPTEVITNCQCYPKCEGYRFRVVAKDKTNYGQGNFY